MAAAPKPTTTAAVNCSAPQSRGRDDVGQFLDRVGHALDLCIELIKILEMLPDLAVTTYPTRSQKSYIKALRRLEFVADRVYDWLRASGAAAGLGELRPPATCGIARGRPRLSPARGDGR